MKKLLLLLLAAGLLWYSLSPQWRSLERMGVRRFQVLNHPPKEILVGVCWPFAVNQDGMADGLQLALDEINTLGLAGGIPFRMILRDDNFDWEKARGIDLEFAANPHMSAVLGYYDDSFAVKASTIFESSRLLHLIVGANSTSMTAHGFDYIVRTTLSSEKIAHSLAGILADMGHQKYALISEQGPYGADLAYQFSISLNSLNRLLVFQWPYSREYADFRLVVNELKRSDADVIFFAGLEPWAGDFLREARGVGVKADIVGAFSDTPIMRARAGRALEGSMFFDIYDPAWPTPENQAFVQKFRKRFGRMPDSWAAQGYDALHILARGVRITHSANPLDLSYAIRFMSAWEGANGRYKFDGRGELDDKPIFLNQFRNGEPVIIQASQPAPAADVD